MFTRYASFEVSEVLDVKGTSDRLKTASLDKLSDYSNFRTNDGYLYARIRAISSRVNKNNDGWPAVELAGSPEIFDRHTSSEGFTVEASKEHKYGFSTFIGKPIFVDHNNTDPTRARGVIVDAKFHVEDQKTASLDPYYASENVDPEHMPASWVELLLEVDADKFPHLAKAIVAGSKNAADGIDGFSMGCDVEKTICNICKNAATAPSEFCDHIRMKGATFDYKDSSTNERTSRKSYENCYGIKFFEISAVFDPADETALIRELIDKESSVQPGSYLAAKTADNPPPQSENIKAPEDVDTLREEKICPVCGSDMDAEKCDVCSYIEPPDGLNTPDLTAAQDFDIQQESLEGGEEGGSYMDARKGDPAQGLTSSVKWTPRLDPRVAGRINSEERPLQPGQAPATDEPTETIIKDEAKPVTSSTRTASDLIAAAGQTQQENSMSNKIKTAAEPVDPSGKPDKQVDVEAVGGISDASNEATSRPDLSVDVEGKGGIMDASNEQAASPDSTQDVAKEVRTDDSGPTSTFPEGNNGVTKNAPGVTDRAFPTAAAKGVKPIGGPDVQPQRREDVESDEHWHTDSTGTDTWSGTGGNKVNRQQDPVTNVPTQSGGVTSHIVNVFKLADTEVELGMIDKTAKYERIAQLEHEDASVIEARLDTLSRVRTAGLSKKPAVSLSRLPSLKQASSSEPVEKTAGTDLDDPRYDSAVFGI